MLTEKELSLFWTKYFHFELINFPHELHWIEAQVSHSLSPNLMSIRWLNFLHMLFLVLDCYLDWALNFETKTEALVASQKRTSVLPRQTNKQNNKLHRCSPHRFLVWQSCTYCKPHGCLVTQNCTISQTLLTFFLDTTVLTVSPTGVLFSTTVLTME